MAEGKRKLTKRVVDALQPDLNGRDVIYFDAEIPRFGVRVKPSGVKSYVLQYRNSFGQARRYTIGRVGDLTPEQARNQAASLRGEIAKGADPSAKRRANRDAVTVNDLCDDYLAAAKDRIKPNSFKTDRAGITHHIRPLLGTLPVATLTPGIIEKFTRDVLAGKTARKIFPDERSHGGLVRGGPSVAFRVTVILGAILKRGVRDGLLATNPVREIDLPKQQPRRPPPFALETINALGAAIREREMEGERLAGLQAIRFLLLSGCRRMEALTLKWGMVDRRARCLRLPDTKTGPAIRPLGRAALELLASFEPNNARPEDYVFPGGSSAGHFNDLPRVLYRLRKAAGINAVSIHSLRHWYASCAAELNISELLIAGLLGHSVRSVTGRYANAPDSALLAAADRVSSRLSAALHGVENANVVSITG